MEFKVKGKAAAFVMLNIVSFMFVVVFGLAMLGGDFFAYIGRACHYVYFFTFVRPIDYKSFIAFVIGLLALASLIYWIVHASKKGTLTMVEMLAPITSIVLPMVLLSAFRGIFLGVWKNSDKALVVIELVFLAIYTICAIASLVFSFKAARAERKALKASEVVEENVDVKVVEEEPVQEEVKEETEPVVEEDEVEEEKVEEEPVEEEPDEEEPEEFEEDEAAEEQVEEAVVDVKTGTKKVIRRPFDEKMTKASAEIKDNYNILKNELLSYGVKSRLSHGSDTFRLRKEEYARITLVGKNLKLYLATDPKKYEGTTIPARDESKKKCFANTPTMIKVKSALSIKRAKMMIADLMEIKGLQQGEVGNVNYAKLLKNRQARKAKQ